jgi:hypothetical protein
VKPIILYRKSIMEADELAAAQKVFPCVDSVVDVMEGTAMISKVVSTRLVVPRYSVLPFYREVARDVGKMGARLINTYSEHRFVADLGAYTDALAGLTPRTYRLEEVPGTGGPFVVKGETNSKRNQWATHMYATDKRAAIEVATRLMDDSLIGQQTIYVRDFVPLDTFGTGLDGVPISREFRFFVCDRTVLCGGFYWSNHVDWIRDQGLAVPDANEVPTAFLLKVTAAVGDSVPFYVVDVAKTASGEWIVIELNDGQMSGLSEVSPESLYKALHGVLAARKCPRCWEDALLAGAGQHCDKCGSCPSDHEVRSNGTMAYKLGESGAVYCNVCGAFVREWDAY